MADAKEFRKKPVVIQAIQWDGTLSGMDEILSVFTDIRTVAKTSHPPTNTCSFWKIGTLEGSHEVSAGDFIIRGVKGEYCPCKPDIFAMTYEPADATPPADAALADDALCESLIEASDMRWNGDVYVGDGADLMNLVRAALRARAVPVDDVIEKIEEYGGHRENEGGSYATFQKSEARRYRAEADEVLGEIRALLAASKGGAE